MLAKQYRCIHSATCACTTKGHLSEDAIFLVFQQINWNPRSIATLSCVCKWFDDIAKRILWKEFCRTRAPKMMLDLQSSGSHNVDGNWKALGKLLIYCSGCSRGGLFNNIQIPGHFVHRTRFSRTSGKSFLIPQCRTDVLYVSDPCEHLDQGEEGDLGFFRGVFKSFSISRVRKMLIDREAKLHPTERRRLSWSDAQNQIRGLWVILLCEILMFSPESYCRGGERGSSNRDIPLSLFHHGMGNPDSCFIWKVNTGIFLCSCNFKLPFCHL
ncbi:hypothetical protein MRB53_007515 [Persea americana]|uniref:Uncharacterized protein n=1 Tax=Persea americana TaxID=3435 RepID=A0ACC2MKS2_PERAE|nr:hypothetical protein MRB53_007515 [Persea americana]